jgi:hypothetical protein
MALISFSPVQDGTSPQASQVNTPLTTIYDEFNGNITAVNLANNAVTTAKVADGAITPNKQAMGAQYAEVTTSQSVTNTSYVDLGTVGPSVTVTVPASGKVFITFGANMLVGTSGNSSRMTYSMSGANTIAASDGVALRAITSTTVSGSSYVQGIISGLTPGVTTITMKYRSGPAGSATWADRTLTVIPIS